MSSGAESYEVPSKEGLVEGTAIESTYKEKVFNENTKKYEEVEKTSSLGKYKGGSLQGWNLRAKNKSLIIFYDNSKESKGKNFGPITFNERESIRDWFGPNGIKFKEAIFMKVVEGEVEGVIFCDIE